LELWVTVTEGLHANGEYGYGWYRARISSVSNPDELTIEYDYLGVFPYSVAIWDYSPPYSVHGLYHEGKYYLPYTYRMINGVSTVINDAWFTSGLVLNAEVTESPVIDSLEVEREVIYRVHTDWNRVSVPVVVNGQVQKICPTIGGAGGGFPYMDVGQVFSAFNLPQEVIKPADKTLHIVYEYRLED
jgi:hypothetical protein